MKIHSALSKQTCHSAGHARLFLATNWTQQLLWGHRELQGLFCGKESSLQQRQTWALTSLDVESIRTYWEVWGCCCLPHRCFLCPTCQRHSPSTSPFCPCGWFSDGGASDADSSWERAHRCKWCGDLQNAKKNTKKTDKFRLLGCKWCTWTSQLIS